MKIQTKRASCSSALLLFLMLVSGGTFAGGLGHNMLVLVNANSEEALRIAHAYQKLRHIPDGNFIFIDPPDRRASSSAA